MSISRKGLLPRTENVRDSKLFVIATEGALTEKQYFEGLFRSTRVELKVLPSEDTKSAPQYVLERLLLFEQKYQLGAGDQCWLVMDVDRWPITALHQVCDEAGQNNFQVAISNPCFELWLRLHFADADPADTDCKLLKQRLRQELGSYNWANLDVSPYTKERIKQAIQRAELLDIDISQRWPAFPGTHIHKLVRLLLPHLKTFP